MRRTRKEGGVYLNFHGSGVARGKEVAERLLFLERFSYVHASLGIAGGASFDRREHAFKAQ